MSYNINIDVTKLIEAWMTPELSDADVAAVCGCSFSRCRKEAIEQGLPTARRGCANNGRRPEDPTPDEIAEACLEIQKGWTVQQRHDRAGMAPRLLTMLDPR